jgi:hypothetical protein
MERSSDEAFESEAAFVRAIEFKDAHHNVGERDVRTFHSIDRLTRTKEPQMIEATLHAVDSFHPVVL